MSHRPDSLWLAAALATVLLAACGAPRGATAGQSRQLTVLAAASLSGAFPRVADAFEAAHPGVTVTTAFAGSPTLVAQLEAGAPADVLATADLVQMERAERAGLVTAPVVFAATSLAIVTPPDDPAQVGAVADLARPGVRVVLAAPDVPAGRYARQLLEAADLLAAVERNVVSNEQQVTGVTGKVRLGEADAGIVYRADVGGVGGSALRIVAVDGEVTARLPIAVARASSNPALASAFVEFVRGEGGAILQAAGFEAP